MSLNNRGTYALQKIIDAVNQDKEYAIIEETLVKGDNIKKLAMDTQGYHILERIIRTFAESKRKFILDSIENDFYQISIDKHGACFLKELIKHTAIKESQ